MNDNPKPVNKFPPKRLISNDINQGKTVTINRGEGYDRSRNFIFDDATGAEEYGWYGWARYNGYKDGWNLIGRLTWS